MLLSSEIWQGSAISHETLSRQTKRAVVNGDQLPRPNSTPPVHYVSENEEAISRRYRIGCKRIFTICNFRIPTTYRIRIICSQRLSNADVQVDYCGIKSGTETNISLTICHRQRLTAHHRNRFTRALPPSARSTH